MVMKAGGVVKKPNCGFRLESQASVTVGAARWRIYGAELTGGRRVYFQTSFTNVHHLRSACPEVSPGAVVDSLISSSRKYHGCYSTRTWRR